MINSEYVIKNGLFCYLAAHFIDLSHILKIQMHKIVDLDDESSLSSLKFRIKFLEFVHISPNFIR